MSDILSELLFYPFEKEVLPWPESDHKSLFINAQYSNEAFTDSTAIQFFKPYATMWKNNSFHCIQRFDQKEIYDFAFVVLSKQKNESHYFLAQALNNLKENGKIIAVAANDAGGSRLEKWMQVLGLQTQNLSKKKCRIVWASKNNINTEKLQAYEQSGMPQEISLNEHTIHTQAGIYGWQNIDQGSKILIDAIEGHISGIGADFGCGYGYLSIELLNKYTDIKKLYAIDADYRAVQCAESNMKDLAPNVQKEYLWHDLMTRPEKLSPLDFILMNPPFHEGKKTDSNIGQKFIQTASKSLRQKGTLYMVANVHLPYERILETEFSKVEKLIEKNGFKVFKATK